MEDFELDYIVDKEYGANTEVIPTNEIKNIVTQLELASNNKEMLTKVYTDILEDENVVYILTRISQNQVFKKHFPEFYEKSLRGESVINCQQNSPYHRFGVFKHILYTIEYIGNDNVKYNSHDLKLLKWTMLLHDIGKPRTKTINSQGYDSFHGHEDMSEEMAKRILERFDFEEEDKRIMLKLIKYHDKFLNEGELTYENLSFLASELDDRRDLFRLLIEVKIADNKAKALDVYSKFMTVVGKYYEFENEYFSNMGTNKLFEVEVNKNEENEKEAVPAEDLITAKPQENAQRGEYQEGGSDEDITQDMINEITKDITNNLGVKCYFQPVIDLKKEIVNGYELYYKIKTKYDFSYKQILRKAREFDKYDKIQQMLFVNGLETFNSINNDKELVQYVNIDAKSYERYVNKSRIFDLIEDNKVVIELNNFEILLNSKISEINREMILRKANAALDDFEKTSKTLKDIEQIGPKYIKYKLLKTDLETKEQLLELATFCDLNSINLIVTGIDNFELLKFASECNIRFVEGNYFSVPTEGLDMDQDILESKLSFLKEETKVID